jgi:hypothetical protein
VVNADIDAAKVESLREGRLTIYEPGLEVYFDRGRREDSFRDNREDRENFSRDNRENYHQDNYGRPENSFEDNRGRYDSGNRGRLGRLCVAKARRRGAA